MIELVGALPPELGLALETLDELLEALDAALPGLEEAAPRTAAGPPLEVSLSIVDDEGIRALNARWRGKDTPTDVLSFAQGDGEPDPMCPWLLGDIVISWQTLLRQAEANGWSPRSELHFLLVHGLLHLLGHDHMQPEERQEMEAREQVLWRASGGSGQLREAGAPER